MPDRISLTILVNLDPIPGAMHTPEQARDSIQAMLLSRIPHYEPIVLLDE